MADEISGGFRNAKDFFSGCFLQTADFFKRSVEWIEDAVELHAHLIGERVAGNVVGRNRRAARITKIVGMILRLEHIEDMRTERLRCFHYPRTGRIMFACDIERRGGAIYDDAVFDQSVDKLRGRRKVR